MQPDPLITKKDFQRMKAIHALKNSFTIDAGTVNALVSQIEEPDKRSNVARFLKGYEVEDVFEELFSQLSAVELLHALRQEQSPSESKKTY